MMLGTYAGIAVVHGCCHNISAIVATMLVGVVGQINILSPLVVYIYIYCISVIVTTMLLMVVVFVFVGVNIAACCCCDTIDFCIVNVVAAVHVVLRSILMIAPQQATLAAGGLVAAHRAAGSLGDEESDTFP